MSDIEIRRAYKMIRKLQCWSVMFWCFESHFIGWTVLVFCITMNGRGCGILPIPAMHSPNALYTYGSALRSAIAVRPTSLTWTWWSNVSRYYSSPSRLQKYARRLELLQFSKKHDIVTFLNQMIYWLLIVFWCYPLYEWIFDGKNWNIFRSESLTLNH